MRASERARSLVVQPFGEILRAAWRSCEELRVVQEQDRVVFGWKEKGKGCVAAVVQSSSEAVGVVAATKPGILLLLLLLLHFVGGFRGWNLDLQDGPISFLTFFFSVGRLNSWRMMMMVVVVVKFVLEFGKLSLLGSVFLLDFLGFELLSLVGLIFFFTLGCVCLM
jgi:hypothetical protein